MKQAIRLCLKMQKTEAIIEFRKSHFFLIACQLIHHLSGQYFAALIQESEKP